MQKLTDNNVLKSGPILLLIMLITSCGINVEHKQLLYAESLLETSPATADSILKSMPIPTRQRDRAWYAVLKTQADYKSRERITSDSLILTATEYYNIRRKNYRAAMAWYSQGCVYRELYNSLSAIQSFLKAKELFPDTLIRYYALTEQCLGDMFEREDMLNNALRMYENTIDNAKRLNDSSMVAYSELKKGLIHVKRMEFNIAESILNRLSESPYLSAYNRRELYLNLSKIATYHKHDYYGSIKYTDHCIKSRSHHSSGFNLRGINFMQLGILDSAETCFFRSLEGQCDIYTLYSNYSNLSVLYQLKNKPDSSLHFSSLSDHYLESMYMNRSEEEISSLIVSNIHEVNKNESYRIKLLFAASSIIAIVIIISLIILSIIQKDRNRKKYYIDRNDELFKQVPVSSDDDLLVVLDSCNEVFNKSVGSRLKNNLLNCRKGNSNDSDVIKHDIRNCFNPVLSKLMMSEYKLTNSELENLVCCYWELDIKDTTLLLNKSYSNISSVRSRLKKKIPKSIYESVKGFIK